MSQKIPHANPAHAWYFHWLLLVPFPSQGVVKEDPYWQSFMEQAVRLLYFLAESPDQLCSLLLQKSTQLLLDQVTRTAEASKESTVQSQGDFRDSETVSQTLSQDSAEQGLHMGSDWLIVLTSYDVDANPNCSWCASKYVDLSIEKKKTSLCSVQCISGQ